MAKCLPPDRGHRARWSPSSSSRDGPRRNGALFSRAQALGPGGDFAESTGPGHRGSLLGKSGIYAYAPIFLRNYRGSSARRVVGEFDALDAKEVRACGPAKPIAVRRADKMRRSPASRRRDLERAGRAVAHGSIEGKFRMLRELIILGPPGAGKGTQAAFIRDHFRIPQILDGRHAARRGKAGTAQSVLRQRGSWDAGLLRFRRHHHRTCEGNG